MLEGKGLTNPMVAPISNIKINLAGFAYVDDADLFVISESDNVDDVHQAIQELTNAWEKAAKVIGGAIEPSKCWWYMLQFQEMDHSCEYKENHDNRTLTVLDPKGVEKEIQLFHPTQAQEMIGVFIAPDGNHVQQLKEFEHKLETYAEKVKTANLHRYEVWTGLQSIVMKSFEYALPVTTLTEKECDKLMWKLLTFFLPKAGINRYVSRAALYAPAEIRGFGLNNPFLTQGISHVGDIAEHLWKATVTGHFIKMSLEYTRLELGLNINILLSNYEKFKSILCTSSWVRSTWQFMSQFGITLQNNTRTIEIQRERDSPLMAHVMSNNYVSDAELKTFNKCRMFLRIFNVSDMTTGDGNYITTDAWQGTRPTEWNTDFKWPRTKEPTNKEWDVWRSVLCKSICVDVPQRLDTSLGLWRRKPEKWKWFLTPDHDLIEKAEGSYMIHSVLLGRIRN